ncbi:MAG: hypothetical protein WC655_25585, partial [Candidatus Hydrogenedentales bacterium]
ELWQHLIAAVFPDGVPAALEPLNHIARHGSLARRILRAVDGDTSRLRVEKVYGKLCECLASGAMF